MRYSREEPPAPKFQEFDAGGSTSIKLWWAKSEGEICIFSVCVYYTGTVRNRRLFNCSRQWVGEGQGVEGFHFRRIRLAVFHFGVLHRQKKSRKSNKRGQSGTF
jgi:hypothetical protein